MLVLSLLACVRHTPTADREPTEDERRAACDAGDVRTCLGLVAILEGETPSPTRIREAIDRSAKFAPDNLVAAQIAVLVANAHPDIATPDERSAAWKVLCDGHDFAAACSVGGWELAGERAEDARALWAEGCRLGEPQLCAPAAPDVAVPVELPPAFVEGLKTVGATFHMPLGFHVVPSPDNPHFNTELAILSDDGKLEVRYGLRDDSEVQAMMAKCKPGDACVSDFLSVETSMATVALANVGQLTPDKVKIGPFPPLPVRVEFNANWGLTGAVVADGLFSPDNAPVTLAVLHQDPAANLYVFFIFHDLSAMGALQGRAFHSLRFTGPVGLGGTWLPS